MFWLKCCFSTLDSSKLPTKVLIQCLLSDPKWRAKWKSSTSHFNSSELLAKSVCSVNTELRWRGRVPGKLQHYISGLPHDPVRNFRGQYYVTRESIRYALLLPNLNVGQRQQVRNFRIKYEWLIWLCSNTSAMATLLHYRCTLLSGQASWMLLFQFTVNKTSVIRGMLRGSRAMFWFKTSALLGQMPKVRLISDAF